MNTLEKSTAYGLTQEEMDVISQATVIMESKMKSYSSVSFSNAEIVKSMVRGRLFALDREVFSVLFLDTTYRLISYDELFVGTIDQCTIYIREVARLALLKNAAAVVLAHNHPGGSSEPSLNDKSVTKRICEALSLFSIEVLDHIIVGDSTYSFAENGLI